MTRDGDNRPPQRSATEYIRTRLNGSVEYAKQNLHPHFNSERTFKSLLICSRAAIASTATARGSVGVSQAREMQSATAVDRNRSVEERPMYPSRKSLPERYPSSIVFKRHETVYFASNMSCSPSSQHSFAARHVIGNDNCSSACTSRKHTGIPLGVHAPRSLLRVTRLRTH